MKITYEAWSKDGITEENLFSFVKKYMVKLLKKLLYHGKNLKLCISWKMKILIHYRIEYIFLFIHNETDMEDNTSIDGGKKLMF